MNLGGLNHFLIGHVRQDGGNPLGQHTFAGAGRPYHQHIVSAAGGNFQSPLGFQLSPHIGKVQQGGGSGFLSGFCGNRRREQRNPLQMVGQLPDIFYRVDLQPFGHRPFPGVFRRNKQPPEPGFPGSDSHRQHAPNRPDFSGKGQLSHKNAVVQRSVQLSGGRQQCRQQGKVVHGSLFFLVRGRQIHGNPADRKVKSAVFHRGPHPFPGLPDSGIRQADNIKSGQAAGNVRLHFHRVGFQPE